MKFKIFLLLISLLLAIFLTSLFAPRNYNLPIFQPRLGTQYWHLSTGSKIGFFHISAKGKKKKTSIIYLHGGPGGRVSDLTIESLSPLSNDGYEIYLYDQIGSGHSERLDNIKEYSVDRHQKDLEAILEKIGAEQVILIGQSWGAMLATSFAVYFPEKVKQIILSGPGPILPIRKELANILIPDSLDFKSSLFSNQEGNQKAQNIRSKFMLKWANLFGHKLASDVEADEFITHLFNEVNKSTLFDVSKYQPYPPGAGYYAHYMTLKSFHQTKDLRSKIKQIKIPMLIMRGQYDNQKWGYVEEYLRLFSHSRMEVIPNAGHFIEAEQRSLYLSFIRKFLLEEQEG